MPLPKLEVPTYDLKLSSIEEAITFRPFLVKEQKVLMMAQESDEKNAIQQGIADVISSCTHEKIDPWKIPSFDLEYIFLNIRSKSVGEEVEKILLTALEGEQQDMIRAMKQIMNNCVETEINLDELPLFDLEYLFLNLRSKSVGETVEVNIVCPDDEKTSVEVDIDLDSIKVQKTRGHKTTVKLDDQY